MRVAAALTLAALLAVAAPQPAAQAVEGDGVGVHRGNEFLLRAALRGGAADHAFAFGRAGDTPLVGDWNGDGRDTVGVRRGATFHLRNTHASGRADTTFAFGRPGDTALVGDWNGDGRDTVGVRRGATFHLRNTHAGGRADTTFTFGRAADVPLVGRWGRLERRFSGRAEPLPASVRSEMTGVSWHPGCPVGLDDLALVTVTHHGFDGRVHTGELVVAARVAPAMLDVFRDLFDAGFPIQRLRRVDHYGGDDDASMAANNSSAFNCRPVTGGSAWSEHAYGTAIDLNPVQNPYVRGATVLPPAGAGYLDRTDVRRGMIVRPGPAVRAFGRIGWGWGGDWASLKDYMHFSESGR